MSRLWVGIIAGAGGVVVGLYIAKLYARNEVKDTVDSFLSSVGLGGGEIQKAADGFIPTAVVG